MEYYKVKLSFGWIYIRVQDNKWQAWHPTFGDWAGEKIEEHLCKSPTVVGWWSEEFTNSDICAAKICEEVTQLEVLVVLGSKAVKD